MVTVVIVNWNGARFLDRCLAAVLAQTFQPHEIVLVDNASSDASLEIARRYPSIRVLAQERNLGFASANNLAINEITKTVQWIALLNPDAYVEPNWLEELVLAAEAHPEFAAFGSKLLRADNISELDGTGDVYHMSGLVWRIAHGKQECSVPNEKREIFSPCAAAALYRRSALVEVGGFDEDYFCYVEDVDLGFRLRLAGYRCLYVPSSVGLHVGSGTTGATRSDFSTYHGHRNLVWTYIKNMPGVLFWALLPLHIFLNVVTLVYFTGLGYANVIWAAKWDAIKGIPKAWIKRRDVQRHRRASVFEVWAMLDKRLTCFRR